MSFNKDYEKMYADPVKETHPFIGFFIVLFLLALAIVFSFPIEAVATLKCNDTACTYKHCNIYGQTKYVKKFIRQDLKKFYITQEKFERKIGSSVEEYYDDVYNILIFPQEVWKVQPRLYGKLYKYHQRKIDSIDDYKHIYYSKIWFYVVSEILLFITLLGFGTEILKVMKRTIKK